MVSCVSGAVLTAAPGGYQPGVVHCLTLKRAPVRLAASHVLGLLVDHYYRLVRRDGPGREWVAETASYYFALRDGVDREILAYHFHPHVESVAYPQLHVGPGAVNQESLIRAGLSAQHNALRADVAGAHLPTGSIVLRLLVRPLITPFGVGARRRDWRSILADG